MLTAFNHTPPLTCFTCATYKHLGSLSVNVTWEAPDNGQGLPSHEKLMDATMLVISDFMKIDPASLHAESQVHRLSPKHRTWRLVLHLKDHSSQLSVICNSSRDSWLHELKPLKCGVWFNTWLPKCVCRIDPLHHLIMHNVHHTASWPPSRLSNAGYWTKTTHSFYRKYARFSA